jgi:hypothetical protein
MLTLVAMTHQIVLFKLNRLPVSEFRNTPSGASLPPWKFCWKDELSWQALIGLNK